MPKTPTKTSNKSESVENIPPPPPIPAKISLKRYGDLMTFMNRIINKCHRGEMPENTMKSLVYALNVMAGIMEKKKDEELETRLKAIEEAVKGKQS